MLKANLSSNPIQIQKSCNTKHSHCMDICSRILDRPDIKITQEYFNDFISMVKFGRGCCFSDSNNKKSKTPKYFVLKYSELYTIQRWDEIAHYFIDDELCKVLENQFVLNPNLCEEFIQLTVIVNEYDGKSNIINSLFVNSSKLKSVECILNYMTPGQFSRFSNTISKRGYSKNLENIIVKFIEKHKDTFLLKSSKEMVMKIMNNFSFNSQIIKKMYKETHINFTKDEKLIFLNKCLSSDNKDEEMILYILESDNITPDFSTIVKLMEKHHRGYFNANSLFTKQVANIINILCDYGLVITKEIVILLLEHGCYINNLEKYGIQVDRDILAVCASYNYYPYKYDIIPDKDILIKECSKADNLNTLKKLKELGGVYTSECLEEACNLNKNGRAIKFLLTECENIKVTDKCLENYQNTYKLEALDILMKKYKSTNDDAENKLKTNSDPNNNFYVGSETCFDIDPNSIMNVNPKNIIVDKTNGGQKYIVKSKIKKFFEIKSKSIEYIELYQIVLKYLISNKLIIGNYFIISEKLSELLKMNHCTILHIDQLHNIMTYFIEPIEQNDIGNSNSNNDISQNI